MNASKMKPAQGEDFETNIVVNSVFFKMNNMNIE